MWEVAYEIECGSALLLPVASMREDMPAGMPACPVLARRTIKGNKATWPNELLCFWRCLFVHSPCSTCHWACQTLCYVHQDRSGCQLLYGDSRSPAPTPVNGSSKETQAEDWSNVRKKAQVRLRLCCFF